MPSFGTSGIRGIYPTEINEEVVLDVIKRWMPEGPLYIGRDIREHSLSLYYSAISAALSTGTEVFELGIAPTPTVAYNSKDSFGVVITASHNPPEYNGIKLMEKSVEITKEKGNEILKREKKEAGKNGRLTNIHEEGIIRHVQRIKDAFGELKKTSLTLDCNGSSKEILPLLFADHELKLIHCGKKMERPSEPTKENLSYLEGTPLALATDGDGDRVALIKKEYIRQDALLSAMIIFMHELTGKRTVVSTVDAGLMVKKAVEEINGTLITTPVGSTYVGEVLLNLGENGERPLIGGEPSGEFIFPEISYTPDGISGGYGLIKLLQERPEILDMVLSWKFYRLTWKIRVKRTEDKSKVMEELKKEEFDGKKVGVDGIRVEGEGYFFLIRPSGTEPVIRLTVEGEEKEETDKLFKRLVELIKEKTKGLS